MSKTIINNRSSYTDKMVTSSVAWIMMYGRRPDNYVTEAAFDRGRLTISAKRNKDSDTFTAYDTPRHKVIK